MSEFSTIDLAIFDLDNTLIAGDSDYAWGDFLVAKGIVDKDYYAKQNAQFYDDYQHGKLNIADFLRFSLRPLADNNIEQLNEWRGEFLNTVIEPMMLPAAEELVEKHRHAGHELLIITATNTFITQPIAERLGIKYLIGTEPERINGRYTGEVYGIPSFQEGKIKRLDSWLKKQQFNINQSWFYSDSHNDLPLLRKVDTPVAVDPDNKLREYAQSQHWDIISLRTKNDQ